MSANPGSAPGQEGLRRRRMQLRVSWRSALSTGCDRKRLRDIPGRAARGLPATPVQELSFSKTKLEGKDYRFAEML